MINRAKLVNFLHTKVYLRFKDGEEIEAILLRVDLNSPYSKCEVAYKATKIFNEEISAPNGTDLEATVSARLSDLEQWKALE